MPINVAKELMGHSDISVTAKIYTQLVDTLFEQNRKGLEQYAEPKEQNAINTKRSIYRKFYCIYILK